MKGVSFLNVVALLAIVVSVGGLISTYSSLVDLAHSDSITGHATSSGVVNVTVSTSVSANLTIDNVFWGAGIVDDGALNATIDTEGNIARGNWSGLSEGLVIKNDGNVALTLEISSNKNASEFLGGTNASYQYKVTNVDSGACTPSAITLGVYHDINSTPVEVCDPFEVNESVNIDFRLVIPSNSDAGVLTSTITAGYGAA